MTAPHRNYSSGFNRRERRPGWVLHRVRGVLDGRAVDHVEAAVTFADQPWAEQAEYVGSSRGFHCYQRPPEVSP